MKRFGVAAVILAAGLLMAATVITSVSSTNVSITGSLTLPGSTSFPGSCTANRDIYIKTDATPAGQQAYLCNAAGNGWNLIGGAPGGSNQQCQFNNAGVFGGDAGCTYDPATDKLSIASQVDTDLFTVSFTPAAGDYQKEIQLNNRNWWAHSSGSGAFSNYADWDGVTDHRWEAHATSGIVGPTVITYGYDGTVRFLGAPIASYTAGDALTLNQALKIDTGTATPTVTVGGNAVVTGTTSIGNLFHMTPIVTLPATCAAGDFYTKTDGAVCHCYATNSYEQIGSQGVCL